MEKKRMKPSNPPPGSVLVCTPDNTAEFNARLRTELPEFFAFAKALHAAGLIDGLRGARIGPAGSLGEDGVVPHYSESDLAALRAESVQGGVQGE